jgi:cysteine desulfurase
MTSIYLDYNASTPIDPAVAAAMRPFLDQAFGNPSSGHWASTPAKAALENARSQVAELLGCSSDEIVFTSGGSEANNLASTILISVMHANNEVGTIQPVEEIATIAREHGIRLHTDAAQSVGKIPTKVDTLGVDLLTIAGHKLYAPKGVGALYVRRGVELEPLIHGAGHEHGRRAGTESALLAVGLGGACTLAMDLEPMARIRALRERLWSALQEGFGDRVVLNGHPEHRLPNTLNVSFVGVVGADVLAGLDGVAAPNGSACHAGSVELSPVLAAMGVPERVGMGAVRFSLGPITSEAQIDAVIDRLARLNAW